MEEWWRMTGKGTWIMKGALSAGSRWGWQDFRTPRTSVKHMPQSYFSFKGQGVGIFTPQLWSVIGWSCPWGHSSRSVQDGCTGRHHVSFGWEMQTLAAGKQSREPWVVRAKGWGLVIHSLCLGHSGGSGKFPLKNWLLHLLLIAEDFYQAVMVES